jgi:hypothetical protein
MIEWQQRILAELEERQEDNVFALLNTIETPRDDFAQLCGFKSALEQLIPAGTVLLGMEGFVPRNAQELDVSASLELLATLEKWFRFDETRSLWTLREGDLKTARIPFVFLTDDGLAKSREILEKRGYQWWRQTKK